jgi:transcriptional regulator with XRE-family HTH domain
MPAPRPAANSGNDDADRLRLAERLRAAREYVGFSQDQVANYLGVPRSALSNMETGQRRVEAVELKRLATLYKKPLGYFTDGPAPEASKLPDDVEHLARKVAKLSEQDRAELSRFADFLRTRKTPGGGQ